MRSAFAGHVLGSRQPKRSEERNCSLQFGVRFAGQSGGFGLFAHAGTSREPIGESDPGRVGGRTTANLGAEKVGVAERVRRRRRRGQQQTSGGSGAECSSTGGVAVSLVKVANCALELYRVQLSLSRSRSLWFVRPLARSLSLSLLLS